MPARSELPTEAGRNPAHSPGAASRNRQAAVDRGLMIFVAAVASTQSAIFFMGRQADRQAEMFGAGLPRWPVRGVLPHATRRDENEVEAALERALAFHEGVVDRRLAFVPAEGRAVEAAREGIADGEPIPREVGLSPDGFIRADDATIWIWRRLQVGSSTGTVVANLDTSPFEAGRSHLRWLLIAFDLFFSGACAIAGFFLVRRTQRPVTTVARHLLRRGHGHLETDPPKRDP